MRPLALAAALLLAPLATACDSDDPAVEGSSKPSACVEKPGIARPPTATLPCELLPPDFVAR